MHNRIYSRDILSESINVLFFYTKDVKKAQASIHTCLC